MADIPELEVITDDLGNRKSQEDIDSLLEKRKSQRSQADTEPGRKKSLGFRDWDEQQKAVDEFHQKEAERKAMEEQKRAEELARREAEVFQRTLTGLDNMKKMRSENDRLERLKRMEEAKRKEEEAHAKHHNLRKELEAAERAKLEAERKAAEEAEKEREEQLKKQALKMKKFEEDRRWKTLPNWKKEREEDLLAKVKKLKSYDPTRTKYEFFDVHRVPDAWDEELLDIELKKAKYAKGEEMLKQLQDLQPDAEKTTYFLEDREDVWDEELLDIDLKKAKYAKGEELLKHLQDLWPKAEKTTYFLEDGKEQWNFRALEKEIYVQSAEVKAEEEAGTEGYKKLLLINPSAEKSAYWDGAARPRWQLTKMEDEFAVGVKVIFSDIQKYDLEVKEDTYKINGEWQVTKMKEDLANYKYEEGNTKFKLVEEVMKTAREPVDRAKYFNGRDSDIPWNLELMEKDLNNRVVVEAQITMAADGSVDTKKIVVGNDWPCSSLSEELAKILSLREAEMELLFISQIDGRENFTEKTRLGDILHHNSIVCATLRAPSSCCAIL